MNVRHFLVVGLAGVEEAGHVVHAFVLLSAKHEACKLVELRSEFFFVHSVEACDQVRVLQVSLLDVA